MSSSCPDCSNLALAVIVPLLAGAAGAALAADTHVQPAVEVGVEAHNNYDLNPNGSASTETYGTIADLSALIDIATPRSDTMIRPRLRLQDYSDRDDIASYEAFLDLRSSYQSERSNFLVIGRYARRDNANAQVPAAAFNDLDPEDPTAPETGARQFGETQQRFDVRPSYSYRVTERASLGAQLLYQAVRYSSQAPFTSVDYDFIQGDGYMTWAYNPQSDLRVRAYASNYDAKDGLNQTDSYGGAVGMTHRWSEVVGTEVEVVYQHSNVNPGQGFAEESSSGWGATVAAYGQGETDRWRVLAGRTFTPTGGGGMSAADQIRIQYDRDISERLTLSAAGRYLAENSVGRVGATGDRDYARADLSLRWMIAPTWYIGGGYSYRWQDGKLDPDPADDNMLFVSVGYQGLGSAGR